MATSPTLWPSSPGGSFEVVYNQPENPADRHSVRLASLGRVAFNALIADLHNSVHAEAWSMPSLAS